MISIPYTNDNPTPIRRRKNSFLLGGENPDAVNAPISYTPNFKPVNEDEPTEFNPDGTPIESEEDQQAKKQKKQQRNQMLLNGAKAIPFAIDALASYSKQIDQNQQLRTQIMQQNRQKPIWDYNSMYGDNQPIIKAKDGALVRTTTSDAAPYKIDNGEFLMLPDGKLERASGSSKKTDDISTILPQGTKIFSNTLKPNKSKDTFAKIAIKHDYSKELEVLENPYSTPVSRTSAERMLQRKQKNLNTLFEEQQSLNGDSSGEISSNDEASEHKSGGWIKKAINPSHKGWCTPLSNPHCTGHRRALALTFKKHHGFHHEDGGEVEYAYGGELKTGRQPIPIATPYGPPIMLEEEDVQPMEFTKRDPKRMLDENGRMIYKNGGKTMNYVNGGKPTKAQQDAIDALVEKDKAQADNPTIWGPRYYQLAEMLRQKGITIDPTTLNNRKYHQLEMQYFPERVAAQIKDDSIPLNNEQRKLTGSNATKYSELTEAQKAKLDDKTIVSSYGDLPGHRTITPEQQKYMSTPEFKAMSKDEQDAYVNNAGNQYSFKDSKTSKTPYRKQNLPFYQAMPEISGFVSALNTYNYQTPDYQHWEQSPNKLNIQPQLQSIDSSLNAINQTTTGSPQIDNARRIGAFTQALNAKQQAFSNKQNYDAEKEYQATAFNINARTNEQNQDITAQSQIYNEFMPLAKDYAAGERIAALSSLTTKYALNAQNENEKALRLQRGNYKVDGNGNITLDEGMDYGFGYNPYSTSPDPIPTKEIPGVVTPAEVKPITTNEYPLGATDVPRKKPLSKTPFYDPNSPLIDSSPVRITNRYGSFIRK